jgi:hypothetical protein
MIETPSSLWEKICCFLSELASDYGDPESSHADTVTLGGQFSLLMTTKEKSVVILRNVGEVNIEIALKLNASQGAILQPGDPLTLYNFRGSIYGRGNTGVVNYLRIGRW